MPSRNVVKQFVSGGIYHVYNRGVEKRKIFVTDTDYQVMMSRLDEILSPPSDSHKTGCRNHKEDVDLLAYCLMPNHYHFLFKLKTDEGLTRFMRTLMTSYTMYFNKRHRRVGSLFQGVYKASQILSEPYLFHISRYIHRNPSKFEDGYYNYPYSSYRYYRSDKIDTPAWLNDREILSLFSDRKGYKDFTEDWDEEYEIDHEVTENY